nr:serine/threonine-protein kinase [Streptomyces sp. HNM0574]
MLEEPLGRGATGTVWRASQRETAGAEASVAGQPGEAVAIKVLKEELANDADVVMRFLRERSVLLRLTHHNIVRTRDLVVEGDMLALVMDLVDGPDLHHYLRDNGPFSPVGAALVVAQVADALAASHADGVVHRDLKPANVLLAESEEEGMRPMLTDFGIARLADSPGLTRAHEFVGTPAYVAPESAEGRPQTSAVDIYGAGVLLYELLTGRPPFSGGTALEVLQRHLSEEPQRPPGIPEPLWTVLERCLRKNPEERPSAENLARSLRTVASGVGASATPEQATAALGVAALLAPDPSPATVPGTGMAAAAAGSSDADPTQALPHNPPGQGQATYDPEGATSVMPQTPGHGGPGNSGPGDPGQGQDGHDPYGQDQHTAANAQEGQGTSAGDPTQVMPPVPGGPPPGPPPQGQPEGPHPWGDQMRAARDRNEPTQVQPLDPSLDPLRRRPQRAPQPPPPSGYGQQYAQPYEQDYGRQPQRPPQRQQRRPAQPPPQRYEPEPPRSREPRREREPRRRSANPMHIPGLGCLKGCLFMILVLVVIAVLVWNFTPVPEWWAQGKSFWESVQDFFGKIQDFTNSTA